MKKEWLVKTFTLCVVVLFICVSFQPAIAENKTSIINNQSGPNIHLLELNSTIFENVSSLHVNLSGPRFWYVIKVYFSKKTSVTQDYYFYISSKNEIANARATFFCEIPYKEGGYGYGLEVPNAYLFIKDFYFQFKFGRLNWSYYNIYQDGDSLWTKGHGKIIYFNLPA